MNVNLLLGVAVSQGWLALGSFTGAEGICRAAHRMIGIRRPWRTSTLAAAHLPLWVIWTAHHAGLIPAWLSLVLGAGVVFALWRIRDDDRRPPRKRRLRSAWKRARRALARGIPAPAPPPPARRPLPA